MNYLSLFSGIGGLDLGLDRAGWTCVGQVEIDPFCRRVLAKHWPEVPRHDDVRTAVAWWRSERRPRLDVVVGGFPCQPVSLAGRQLAQADERWLWPAAHVVVRELRPDWVLLENVPGLLRRGMGDVLGDLAACGYDAAWDCVPAAAVGAPHRRDRVFVAAYSSRQPGRLQPEPESRGGGKALVVDYGTSGHVANPEGERWGTGRSRRLADDRPARPPEPTQGLAPDDVAHPNSPTWRPEQGHAHTRVGAEALQERASQPRRRSDDLANTGRVGRQGVRQGVGLSTPWPVPGDNPWWGAEPDVGRMADGVPSRVDRLRALGNAVVPQVAEHIGRMILASA